MINMIKRATIWGVVNYKITPRGTKNLKVIVEYEEEIDW